MSAENKHGIGTDIAEISQRWDVVSSIGAVGLYAFGVIPIGFTLTYIGFSALTYYGAEKLKSRQ